MPAATSAYLAREVARAVDLEVSVGIVGAGVGSTVPHRGVFPLSVGAFDDQGVRC